MEEVLYEMTYTINGDKYLITAKKINEENDVKTCINDDVCDPIDLNVANEDEDIDTITFNNDVTVVSISDIPDGMSVDQFLDIVDKFGIVLLK